MARPDSGAIDRAILAVLQADPQLAALMPGGVWFGVAAAGLTRFVLVTLVDAVDEGLFGQRGIEDRLYRVHAVGLSHDASIGDMKAAAYRIDTLLEGDAPIATPEDYGSIDCVRETADEISALDELDKSLTWHNYGGEYRVTAAWPDPDVAALATGGSAHVD